MLWVVPPFLRNLPVRLRLAGGGGGSRMGAGARLRTVGSVKKRAAGRLAAAAPSSALSDAAPLSYYSYQESGPGQQVGVLEQATGEMQGPEADSVPIVIKCE